MEIDNNSFEAATAERLKQLREANGLTLDQLANASGVSRAMISRIERGEASPTASLLARICAALGLSLSGFFTEQEQRISPLVRRSEQPTWIDPETGYVRRAISPPRLGSDVDIVEVSLPGGARVSFPPHGPSHGMTQYIWLFEGALDMTLGEQTYSLGPGDCLFMPVGEGHIFHNPKNSPAHYAVVLDQRKRA